MRSKLSILLLCAGGNSTSILVSRMKRDLHPDENWTIDARSWSDLSMIVGKYDYVLVAPQIMFQYDEICRIVSQYDGIRILRISGEMFAACDGCRINAMIRKCSDSYAPEEREENMSEKANLMDRLSGWMNEYLVPVGQKISNQRHLAAVKDGLTVLIPATIVGGFAILLAVPPVPTGVTEPSNFFYAFLLAWQSWANTYKTLLMTPYNLTIGIISLYVVCGVSYRLAVNYKMNGLNNMISALLVFLTVSGALDMENGSILISRLGAGYMFAAMLIAIFVVEITRAFDTHNIKIKMPDSVPPNVAAPFNVLIALVFNVVLFSILNALLTAWTGGGIPDLIYLIFQPLIKASGTLPSILFLNFLATLFWFFGIHGNNMMAAVVTPITTMALAANAEAVAAGQPLPYIFAGAMSSVFGAWIACNNAMNLVILLTAKSKRTRSLAKIAAVPALFDIGEPYVFGLPQVLNVYYLIPSLIAQTLNITAYYLLASAGIVGKFYISLPFTTPAPLQALLATGGNVPTFILAIVLILVDMVIFYPFMKTYDNQLVKEETENAE